MRQKKRWCSANTTLRLAPPLPTCPCHYWQHGKLTLDMSAFRVFVTVPFTQAPVVHRRHTAPLLSSIASAPPQVPTASSPGPSAGLSNHPPVRARQSIPAFSLAFTSQIQYLRPSCIPSAFRPPSMSELLGMPQSIPRPHPGASPLYNPTRKHPNPASLLLVLMSD
jgi:hypothetical protein